MIRIRLASMPLRISMSARNFVAEMIMFEAFTWAATDLGRCVSEFTRRIVQRDLKTPVLARDFAIDATGAECRENQPTQHRIQSRPPSGPSHNLPSKLWRRVYRGQIAQKSVAV